jgi:hypothetical protein
MRTPLGRILAVAALLAGSHWPAPAAAADLQPFSASYVLVYGSTQAGTVQVRLENLPDGRWSYRAQMTPRVLARVLAGPWLPAEVQRSVFRIQDNQIIPESFTAEDKSSSKDQQVTFDWAAGRVRGVVERKPVDLAIQPGLLDEMSVQAALMHALLGGRIPERFVMLDEDRIKEYLYTTEGRERLKADTGEYDAMVFRSSRPGSRKGTWFWCAPELGFLPLKVERRDGRNVEWSMRLLKVTR